MQRIYILHIKYKSGSITIGEEISVFNTKELAESGLREVKKSNDIEFTSDIFESKLYEASDEVPILQNKDEEKEPERLLHCNIGVRYYEDGDVDGIQDISFDDQRAEVKPQIPCVRHFDGDTGDDYWRWCPIIDVDKGRIVNWEQGKTADVHYKVCDDCMIDYCIKGSFITNNDGYWYCPTFLCPQGEGYGDYVIMRIDENGYIDRWNKYDVDKWCNEQLENKEN